MIMAGKTRAAARAPAWTVRLARLLIGALCAATTALLICCWLGRLALDRRRLAKWASEWSLTGPRWTSRL
jgi:hypothetical protein